LEFFQGCSIQLDELKSFTVVLTDECNFSCAYCYQQKGRGRQRLDYPTLVKAINYFHPLFVPGGCIHFYGGEPLLAFDLLERIVEYVDALPQKYPQRIRYSLTTNGSLLNKDILGFLEQHEFSLTLSFDGLAQDLSRKKGSFDFLKSLIPEILGRRRISFGTNSVFSSETIGYLSDSVQCLVEMDVPRLDINFANEPLWTPSSLLRMEEELALVGKYFRSRYQHLKDIPWTNFYEELEKSVYYCDGGLNQMALSAQGALWGCVVFPYFFKEKEGTDEYQKYCFGHVYSFLKDPEHIYAQKIVNYSNLSMDQFSTPSQSCLMCAEIERCWVCPLAAAFATGETGKIPAWMCQGSRILRRERRLLVEHFKKNSENKERSSG
jgi:sulfatase maturation enzyme AslB (radical SAM superfamily)